MQCRAADKVSRWAKKDRRPPTEIYGVAPCDQPRTVINAAHFSARSALSTPPTAIDCASLTTIFCSRLDAKSLCITAENSKCLQRYRLGFTEVQLQNDVWCCSIGHLPSTVWFGCERSCIVITSNHIFCYICQNKTYNVTTSLVV